MDRANRGISHVIWKWKIINKYCGRKRLENREMKYCFDLVFPLIMALNLELNWTKDFSRFPNITMKHLEAHLSKCGKTTVGEKAYKFFTEGYLYYVYMYISVIQVMFIVTAEQDVIALKESLKLVILSWHYCISF